MIADLLRRSTFPASGTSVVCGLSGGADSTALVRLAVAAGCVVTAVHVNHGLRPSAVDDERCAHRTAERLDIAFRVEHIELADGPNLEARARVARQLALGTRGADRPHRRRPGRDDAARVAARFGRERARSDVARADATDPGPAAIRDGGTVRDGGFRVRARSVECRPPIPAEPNSPRTAAPDERHGRARHGADPRPHRRPAARRRSAAGPVVRGSRSDRRASADGRPVATRPAGDQALARARRVSARCGDGGTGAGGRRRVDARLRRGRRAAGDTPSATAPCSPNPSRPTCHRSPSIPDHVDHGLPVGEDRLHQAAAVTRRQPTEDRRPPVARSVATPRGRRHHPPRPPRRPPPRRSRRR